MSDAENKPTTKPESKPAAPSQPVAKAESKPADKVETKSVTKVEPKPSDTAASSVVKPVGKVENRQAGKGSKRRPFNAKQFGVNYETIHWGRGQSQRPKH